MHLIPTRLKDVEDAVLSCQDSSTTTKGSVHPAIGKMVICLLSLKLSLQKRVTLPKVDPPSLTLWKNEEGSEMSHDAFGYSMFLQLILWVVDCLIHYSF